MKSSLNRRRWVLWGAGLLALLGSPTATRAAPFCLTNQAIPPQCIYTDPSICQRDAARQGGVCSVNTAEYKPQPGIGRYCVVTPSLVSLCVFPDRGSCEADAQKRHGACVTAPGVAPFKAPDPYAAIGGR